MATSSVHAPIRKPRKDDDTTKNDKTTKKKKQLTKFFAVLNFMILIGIIAGIPALVYLRFPAFIDMMKDRESLHVFLLQYRTAGMFIYAGLQAVQVVVAVIPGQVVQLAGGYAYGLLLGTLLSVTGIAAGTIIAFYLGRLLGRRAIHILFDEKKVERFIRALNSRRAYTVLFILFFIPGIPKDPVAYAAGLSEMRLRVFLMISLLGRLPAMMVTVAAGKMLRTENYAWLWAICILVGLICLVLFVFRKKIARKFLSE